MTLMNSFTGMFADMDNNPQDNFTRDKWNIYIRDLYMVQSMIPRPEFSNWLELSPDPRTGEGIFFICVKNIYIDKVRGISYEDRTNYYTIRAS